MFNSMVVKMNNGAAMVFAFILAAALSYNNLLIGTNQGYIPWLIVAVIATRFVYRPLPFIISSIIFSWWLIGSPAIPEFIEFETLGFWNKIWNAKELVANNILHNKLQLQKDAVLITSMIAIIDVMLWILVDKIDWLKSKFNQS